MAIGTRVTAKLCAMSRGERHLAATLMIALTAR
jgi:hypothetical protein